MRWSSNFENTRKKQVARSASSVNAIGACKQRNLSKILLNQTEINRKMVNTILFPFNLIRFRKDFCVRSPDMNPGDFFLHGTHLQFKVFSVRHKTIDDLKDAIFLLFFFYWNMLYNVTIPSINRKVFFGKRNYAMNCVRN